MFSKSVQRAAINVESTAIHISQILDLLLDKLKEEMAPIIMGYLHISFAPCTTCEW